MPSDPELPASVPMLHVLFSGGSVGGVSRLLVGERFRIGRAASMDLTLLDARVSREHARIEIAPGKATLTDTSSTETQVNGERISSRVLADGDLIRLGDSFVLYRPDAGSADAPAIVGLLGTSPAVRALRKALSVVGPTRDTVLLLGETGSGKAVAARALHELGQRTGAFVAVSCGAVTDSMSLPSFLRAAAGGTLFLDEADVLAPAWQSELARALEEGKVHARIVAASQHPLREAALAGSFRADLSQRLSEATIQLPSLRARREDVLPILLYALGEPIPELDPELVSSLLLYSWPSNVRELDQVATLLRRGQGAGRLGPELFEAHLQDSVPPPTERFAVTHAAALPVADAAGGVTTIPTRAELDALLRRWRGVIADVARETGRSRKQVYRWLDEHGLDLASYRGED
jgi:sigma-54 dependent transcriptional regulator, acetoin dehydrogenase operon transcriptional activator AcoR